jgi:tetratricopeptide (TPR) repeat protein
LGWGGATCSTCAAGYTGANCQHSDSSTCSGHGIVQQNGTCVCSEGWTGANCNICAPGFAGPACEFSAATTCNGHGAVQSDGTCLCEPSWTGANCSTCAPGFIGPSCSVMAPEVTVDINSCRGSEPMTNYALAQQSVQAGELERAATYAKKSIKADPRNASARALLALIDYVRNGTADDGKTIQAVDQAIARDVDAVDAYYYRGILHQLAKHYMSAQKDFNYVLKTSPNHHGASEALTALQARLAKQ